MKRRLIPIFLAAALPLMAASSMARADAQAPAVPSAPSVGVANPTLLTLQDPMTKQMESLGINDISNPERMRKFVAPLPYAGELYEAYVKVGYAPLHALILSNWDASEAMRELAPKLPVNPLMEEKIQNILKLYQPVQ